MLVFGSHGVKKGGNNIIFVLECLSSLNKKFILLHVFLEDGDIPALFSLQPKMSWMADDH